MGKVDSGRTTGLRIEVAVIAIVPGVPTGLSLLPVPLKRRAQRLARSLEISHVSPRVARRMLAGSADSPGVDRERLTSRSLRGGLGATTASGHVSPPESLR